MVLMWRWEEDWCGEPLEGRIAAGKHCEQTHDLGPPRPRVSTKQRRRRVVATVLSLPVSSVRPCGALSCCCAGGGAPSSTTHYTASAFDSKSSPDEVTLATVAASRATPAPSPLTTPPQSTTSNSNMPMSNNTNGADNNNIQNILLARDERIRELEQQLRARDEEIQQLRSHLDKFQSVFPFHTAGTAASVAARPRKQRAQGISAEPQSHSTIQELSQQKFPIFPKNDSRLGPGKTKVLVDN
ncbi:hypothetical protein B566_EDAN003781 [Ephemera danica]|nr:hypothetical protein B566_EDAN003781 [Ephemera danica]